MRTLPTKLLLRSSATSKPIPKHTSSTTRGCKRSKLSTIHPSKCLPHASKICNNLIHTVIMFRHASIGYQFPLFRHFSELYQYSSKLIIPQRDCGSTVPRSLSTTPKQNNKEKSKQVHLYRSSSSTVISTSHDRTLHITKYLTHTIRRRHTYHTLNHTYLHHCTVCLPVLFESQPSRDGAAFCFFASGEAILNYPLFPLVKSIVSVLLSFCVFNGMSGFCSYPVSNVIDAC